MVEEYFDSDELCLFCHAIRLAPDNSGTMCSVSIEVCKIVIDCVVTVRGPTLKLDVFDIDAAVYNIGIGSVSGTLIIVVSCGVASLA